MKIKPNVSQQDRTSIPEGFGYGSEEEPTETPAEQTPPTEPDVTGFEDLDNLAGDMDKDSPADELDKDLGWGSGEEEEEEGDETDAEETDDSEEEESADSDETESDDTDTDEESEESEEETADSEEEEEELFYDTERDFPGEKVAPTTYKDRVALNSGVAAKVNHARELVEKLEGMDKGLGAIELPELFGENEEFVKDPFDRSTFADTEDGDAKKAAFQLDKFINTVKGKISRVEGEYNVAKEKEEVEQEYSTALDNLTDALDKTGIPVQEATQLTQRQILQKADDAIKDYKDNKFDDVYTKQGIDAANAHLRELEQAKATIQGFPEISERYNSVSNKKAPQQQQVSEEQMKTAFQEWEQDRPELPLFNGKTDAEKRDFLEFTRLKIQKGEAGKPGSARSWHKLYSEHQAERKKEYEKYQSTKKKAGKKETPNEQKEQKRKKPPVAKVLNKDRLDRNALTTENVDAELDELAKELDS